MRISELTRVSVFNGRAIRIGAQFLSVLSTLRHLY